MTLCTDAEHEICEWQWLCDKYNGVVVEIIKLYSQLSADEGAENWGHFTRVNQQHWHYNPVQNQTREQNHAKITIHDHRTMNKHNIE